jgi:hypothetical protein
MRKKILNSSSRSDRPAKRALRLSKETIRALTPEDLLQAAGGCPYLSTPGTSDGASLGAAVCI